MVLSAGYPLLIREPKILIGIGEKKMEYGQHMLCGLTMLRLMQKFLNNF